MAEIRFHHVTLDGTRLLECADCGALVRIDDENYAEGNHRALHERIARLEARFDRLESLVGRMPEPEELDPAVAYERSREP